MKLGNYSIRGRLALFTGLAVGALCIVFSLVLLVALNRMATRSLTDEVTAVGELTAYYVDRGELSNPLPPIPQDLVRPVQVVDPHGRVVAATKDLQGRPAMAHFLPRSPRRVASQVVCDSILTGGRCHVVVAQQVYRDGNWTIYSAAPALPFYVYPGVIAILVVGTAILTLTVVCGARRNVTSSLRPVEAIRSQLDHIRSTNPGRRVPVPTAKDEIYRLARSVNQTLDRLESVLDQQRRFCSDASHELRTPITAMRTQLEVALMAPEDTDVPQLCDAVLPSIERLQAIASDLQTLTRLDTGVPGDRQKVDLCELITMELGASNGKVVQRLLPGVTVLGDRSGLGRLVGNLVQNAQRHASSTVTVTLRRGNGDPRFPLGIAEVEVLDDGDGIAADQRETVFRRFTRLDTARSRVAGGVGLGLPIARQIAESHGGTLTIQDSDRGARFVLRLPLHS
ncbi:two-component sensor histidine kinase [Acrocarpospora phusangensis]|uniref:histidine kinase n=1 Tax=Acrocarpospora phusangensis TaxID=1070424 RepID=A0A919UTF0_9ACTN|nr:HAMP domain-containing sensor histidine kinase [Acrocarpospora phusangensis]GIH29688.1 two-component sensor histidine kinase [Acrocarpospora phusangensis]